MAIDWSAFTPASALAGGAIIGVAVAMFALVNGRIAGVSGILGGLLRPSLPDAAWRAAFIAGLLAAPLVYTLVAPLPGATIDASLPVLVIAGLAVGIGTRYASGCTSGHGVCGISRLSPRSLVATATFVGTGMAMVYRRAARRRGPDVAPAFAFLAGLLFGIGLLVSGLANPAKVLGFLDVTGRWDPSLALVMGSAVVVSAIGFALARRRPHTLLGAPMQLPASRVIDRRLVLGSLLFGAGWGLAGFCPGPALVALGAGYGKAVVFVAAMLARHGDLRGDRARPRRGRIGAAPIRPRGNRDARLPPAVRPGLLDVLVPARRSGERRGRADRPGVRAGPARRRAGPRARARARRDAGDARARGPRHRRVAAQAALRQRDPARRGERRAGRGPLPRPRRPRAFRPALPRGALPRRDTRRAASRSCSTTRPARSPATAC